MPALATARHRTAVPPAPTGEGWRPVVFAAITAILVLFTAASSTPSPLYVVYQQQWELLGRRR